MENDMAYTVWKNGRAYSCWRDPETGKIRKRSARTVDPAVAAQHLEACRTLYEKPAGQRPPSTALEALERFLTWVEHARKPGTLRWYTGTLTGLFEHLRHVPVVSWTPRDVAGYLNRNPHWSKRTRAMLLSACRRFLSWARKEGLAYPDFTRNLEPGRGKAREPVVLSQEDVIRVIRELDQPLRTAVALAGLAGLRRADIKDLQWSNVDFDTGHLDFRWSKSTSGRKAHQLIHPVLMECLQEIRATAGPVVRTNLIGGHVCRRIHKATKALGLPRMRLHDFRHSFGTNLARAGVQQVVVRDLLGHSSVATTNLYFHSIPDERDAAIKRLGG